MVEIYCWLSGVVCRMLTIDCWVSVLRAVSCCRLLIVDCRVRFFAHFSIVGAQLWGMRREHKNTRSRKKPLKTTGLVTEKIRFCYYNELMSGWQRFKGELAQPELNLPLFAQQHIHS